MFMKKKRFQKKNYKILILYCKFTFVNGLITNFLDSRYQNFERKAA